jgi:hypothetical protein
MGYRLTLDHCPVRIDERSNEWRGLFSGLQVKYVNARVRVWSLLTFEDYRFGTCIASHVLSDPSEGSATTILETAADFFQRSFLQSYANDAYRT